MEIPGGVKLGRIEGTSPPKQSPPKKEGGTPSSLETLQNATHSPITLPRQTLSEGAETPFIENLQEAAQNTQNAFVLKDGTVLQLFGLLRQLEEKGTRTA